MIPVYFNHRNKKAFKFQYHSTPLLFWKFPRTYPYSPKTLVMRYFRLNNKFTKFLGEKYEGFSWIKAGLFQCYISHSGGLGHPVSIYTGLGTSLEFICLLWNYWDLGKKTLQNYWQHFSGCFSVFYIFQAWPRDVPSKIKSHENIYWSPCWVTLHLTFQRCYHGAFLGCIIFCY